MSHRQLSQQQPGQQPSSSNISAYLSPSQMASHPHSLKQLFFVLGKRSDQRNISEIETFLLPLIKKVELFKEKKYKDHAMTDLANSLKHEFYPKDTIISELPEYDDKMYIVIHGQAVKQVQQVGEGGLFGSMFRSDSRSSNKQDSGAKGGGLFRMRNFSQNNQSSQVMDAPIVPKMNLLSPQAAMFSPVASISVKRAETDGISHLVQTYDPNEAEQQKPKDDFKDVQTLNQGSPFNEQALTKIKALSMIIKSRIKATQDTHFAVLSIADYHRCLAKMEARAITKTLYFLQELPFFKLWSKTMLSKLITSFKTVKFIRGQVIFKEGQANDEIFIVRSGEFSANRTIMFQNSNINQSVVQFVRGQKTHSTLRSVFSPQFNQLTKANSITNASKTRESMQLFLFGKGQIFGEERFVRDEKLAPYTAVCQSLEGECLRISSSDFMKKVYQNTDALSVLKQNINQKETKIQYKQVSGIYNHLWSQKNLAGADAVSASSDKYSDAKISKMLLHNNNEKREGLRQIVEGYPNLKKISNLIRDDQDNIDKSQFSTSLNNNRMASTGFIPESKLFSLPSSPAMLNTSFNFSQTVTFKQKTMSVAAQKAINETALQASKSVSPPPNKESTVMVDLHTMGVVQKSTNHGKPPKKAPGGTKVYVSSKVVDALQYMKRHTEELCMKRTLQKERLQSMPKARVIDEALVQQHNQSKNLEEEEYGDEESEFEAGYQSDYQSQYLADDQTAQGDFPDDLTTKSGGTNKIPMSFSQNAAAQSSYFNKKGDDSTNADAISIIGHDTQSQHHLKKSKQTLSRKSLRSLAVNERDAGKRQIINLQPDELVHLPNKSFYNSDGSKIQILGTMNNMHKTGMNRNVANNREQYAFSPLIQHLLRQRHQDQRSLGAFPGINRQTIKSTQMFTNTLVNPQASSLHQQQSKKKVEEKIVFMQVAGTMNVINNQFKNGIRINTSSSAGFNSRLYTPFTNQRLPNVLSNQGNL